MANLPVRERLLNAADDLLFIDGAFATPVDAILKKAVASPPSLYSHFGSKEGLVAAALRRRLEIWTAVWDDAIASASDDGSRILALWDALSTYQHDHLTERWCAFMGTAASFGEPGAELSAVLDEETALLRDRLGEFSAGVAGERSAALASALMTVYCGTMALMLREPYDLAIQEGRAAAGALIAAFCESAVSRQLRQG